MREHTQKIGRRCVDSPQRRKNGASVRCAAYRWRPGLFGEEAANVLAESGHGHDGRKDLWAGRASRALTQLVRSGDVAGPGYLR